MCIGIAAAIDADTRNVQAGILDVCHGWAIMGL